MVLNADLVGGIIQASFASVSFVASLMTLWLIWDMKRINEYLLLIVNLTVFQAIYDLSIILNYCPSKLAFLFIYFIRIWSGLAATFWTNIMALTVLHLVLRLRTFNLKSKFSVVFIAVLLPSVTTGIVQTVYAVKSESYPLYYWLRIASILLNIVIYIGIVMALKRRDFMLKSNNEYIDPTNDPIKILACRMKYYPIVQIITRIGASWFEYVYGYDAVVSNNVLPLEYGAYMLYSVTLPSAGVGFFLIFVCVSPGVRPYIRDVVFRRIGNCFARLGCCCCDYNKITFVNSSVFQLPSGHMADRPSDEAAAVNPVVNDSSVEIHSDQHYESFQDSSAHSPSPAGTLASSPHRTFYSPYHSTLHGGRASSSQLSRSPHYATSLNIGSPSATGTGNNRSLSRLSVCTSSVWKDYNALHDDQLADDINLLYEQRTFSHATNQSSQAVSLSSKNSMSADDASLS